MATAGPIMAAARRGDDVHRTAPATDPNRLIMVIIISNVIYAAVARDGAVVRSATIHQVN